MKLGYSLIFVFIASSPSYAVRVTTANELVDECKASLDLFTALEHDSSLPSPQLQRDAYHCDGLVEGVSETLDIWTFIDGQKVLHSEVKHACIPAEVTLLQEIKIFLKYAYAHPERLHEAGSNLVMSALVEAFPCKT